MIEVLETFEMAEDKKATDDSKALDEAVKSGRKQALEEVYKEILDLFNRRIRIHNRDFDNAKSEQYKYDLSRDAREFQANFNMVLDGVQEKIQAMEESEMAA